MADKLWSGVDEIPEIGTVTWTVRIMNHGDALVKVFDNAVLAGGDLTTEQLDSIRAFLRL